MSASVLLTKQVLAAAGPEKVWPAIAAAATFDLGLLDDPDARIAHEVHLSVWRHAAVQSGDPLFGLRVAQLLTAPSYGVLGYAMASSATLASAWQRLCTYSALLHDELVLGLERRADHLAFKYSLAGDAGPGALFEAALASLLLNARRLSGDRFRATEVRFRHRHGPSELSRQLRIDVRYGQAENALLAEADSLELPVAGADPALAAVLERYARDLLARLPREQDLVSQVRSLLIASLPGGVPSEQETAETLKLGLRTLQRRLRDQGLTFRGLVDRVRHELALEHLAHSDHALAEIAFLLGFADDKAFHKAFRRWTGTSPGAHRRAQPAK